MTNERVKYRTLIIGTGPLARILMHEISAREQSPYMVVGMIVEKNSSMDLIPDSPLLGTIDDLQNIIIDQQPERIIVSLSERRGYLPIHQLVEARVCRNILIEDGEAVYERLTGKLALEALTPSAVIFSRHFQPSRTTQVAARSMSFVCALFGVFLLAPLFVVLALAIKLDSRGSVLFVQDRIGLAGKRFKLLKFRTMHPARGHTSEWAGDNVDRITRLGRWLRKFRLDELPQFVNVLIGDMNLVGPRPHPASNFEMFVLVSRNTPECGGQIPYYSLRSLVRPGITGWAQVRYQYADNLNEEIEKLRFDLYYVKHCSLWLDIRILFETVKVVVLGHELTGSSSGGDTGTINMLPDRINPASPTSRHEPSPMYSGPGRPTRHAGSRVSGIPANE